ncbi:MAG: beta strand repeat-containing protein [Rhodopirellula sp. JB044]|uniref:beta strand repeat-containing protein n=1 Tax=Rhodopirellula sp. JB044 TaxID=3342844 RepID=UPI00370C1FF9
MDHPRRQSRRRHGQRRSATSQTRCRRTRNKWNSLQFQSLEPRHLLDGFGVRFAFFPSSGTGSELTSLNVGETYLMRTYVQDQRAPSSSTIPSGILQAAFDVPYDPSLLQFSGPITLGSEFQTVPGRANNGEILSNQLDNLNGRDSTEPVGDAKDDELLFFEINVTALATGDVDLDAVRANEANLRAEFYRPFGEVTEFDVTGDQISIVGGGVVFTNAGNLQVTEGGSSSTFQVALNRAPNDDVSFTISPQTANQVSLSSTTLSFSPSNWNTPQSIQITAVNDSVAEADLDVTLSTSNLQSSDSSFSGVSVDDLVVRVNDNDTASVVISPTTGLVTDESGQTATAQVRLNSQPTAPVTVNFVSSDTEEGTVSPGQLTFTSTNWNQNQTLTLRGVDDEVVDLAQTFTVSGTVTSSDLFYRNIAVPTITATNQNTTVAGLIIQPSSGLVTRENGQSDVFNVRLSSQPTSDVILNLSSSDPGEGTVNSPTLTFTPSNWDQTQVVMVSGVNDDLIDGSVGYQINLSVDPSSDANYQSLPTRSVFVTNQDDDVADIIVSEVTSSSTSENGTSSTFTVALASEPTGVVSVDIASNDPSEGSASPTSTSFNSSNWDQPQTITITGVDDVITDGDVEYTITVSTRSTTDSAYNSVSPVVRTLTNQDNDSAGILLENAGDLRVDEDGGTDNFTLRLRSQPIGNVTIQLASSNTDEVTVPPTVITFTPQDWDQSQTITVRGVDDGVIDGEKSTNITFDLSGSEDTTYRALNVTPVTVTNVGDTARLIVSPISGLVTKEANGIDSSDTFGVRLSQQPATDVVVAIVSSDTSEGVPTQTQLTFTPSNFDQIQQVTIEGVDDDVIDGDQTYMVSVQPTDASDEAYRDLAATTVTVVNRDDDIPGLVASQPSLAFTTESGGSSVITTRLQTQPVGTVRIDVGTSDPSEASVSPTFFTFDASNWDTPQSVTVLGLDDPATDGDVSYEVSFTSSSTTDSGYNSLGVLTRSLVNRDNDPAGVILTNTNDLQVDESGSTDSFTVRLQSQPIAEVTVNLASSDLGEATVSPAPLTFTPANWNTPQTVMLTGVDDLAVDGPQTSNITFDLSSSDDTAYRIVSVAPVSVTNTDNDVPGVSVVASNPLRVSETGTSATFTVALNTPPSQTVTINADSNDTSEGTVSPASITFNANNYNQPQTLTVTGVDDVLVDGDVTFGITFTASSGDAAYDGIEIAPISVVNENDDEGGVEVIAGNNLTVSESGTTTTFRVVLKRQPIQDVTVPLSLSDSSEISIDKSELVFTNGNWDTPQIVTITGLADDAVDSDVVANVQIGPTVSNDAEFDALTLTPVPVTVTNVDTASISVTTADVVEGNAGDNASITYTIRLNGDVESGLSLDYETFEPTTGISASSGTDFTPRSGTLSMSGNDGETLQISVPVNGDTVVESDEALGLRLSGLRFATDGIDLGDVTIASPETTARILNDDSATLTLAATTSQTFEAALGSSTPLNAQAVLSSPVQGGLTVQYATTDGTATVANSDYESAAGTLSFAGDSNETQTVSIHVLGDDTPEPDETFTLALQQIGADDPVIRDAITILNSPVNFTILNDDAPRLVLRNITTDATEGNATDSRVFRFEVELTDDVADDDGFTVSLFTSDETATTASGDYTAVDTFLSFAGNANETKTIEVTVAGDTVIESDEAFLIQLGTVSGLADGADLVITEPQLTATIENDDTASLSLDTTTTTITEGDSGTVTSITLTASLTGNVQNDFTVGFQSSDGTATSGSDYSTSTGTLSFGPGTESQSFTIDILGDNVVELSETFSVALESLSGLPDDIASFITLPQQATEITIAADDRTSLSLSGTTSTDEGNPDSQPGTLNFTVTLSNPISSEFQIAYATVDDTAVASEDYIGANGNLSFDGTANESQTVAVDTIADRMVESNESFQFRLGDLTGLPQGLADFIDIDASAVIATINNDDSATLSISGPDRLAEPGGPSASDTATYTVSLSAPVQGGLGIRYATADGTATASSDYDSVTGTITFAGDSNASQNIAVHLRGDSIIENDETFEVALLDLINVEPSIASSISFANESLTTTIADDDTATVEFATDTSIVAETNGNHMVTLALNTTGGAILTEPLEVDVIVRQSSTAGSEDFILNTTRVAFPVGSSNGSSQTISLSIADDGQLEPTESIVLGLQPVATNPGEIVTDSSHIVSVTDDPSDAVLSGSVWADTNANGQRESHEMPIAGVTIRLTGVDNQGRSVQRTALTNTQGHYEFRDLAGGTYQITQDQPEQFIDAVSTRGTITTQQGTVASNAVTDTNSISQIVLPASGLGSEFDFTERGYYASAIPSFSFQARRSSPANTTTAPPPIEISTPDTNPDTDASNSVLDEILANW